MVQGDKTSGEEEIMSTVSGSAAGSKRPLYAIFHDVQALTSQQRSRMWADLTIAEPGVVPRKYLKDEGPNAAGIYSLDYDAMKSSGGQQTSAQISIMSMYIQDNPNYAVNPPFDNSINIPGSV